LVDEVMFNDSFILITDPVGVLPILTVIVSEKELAFGAMSTAVRDLLSASARV